MELLSYTPGALKSKLLDRTYHLVSKLGHSLVLNFSLITSKTQHIRVSVTDRIHLTHFPYLPENRLTQDPKKEIPLCLCLAEEVKSSLLTTTTSIHLSLLGRKG